MRFEETPLAGVWIVELDRHQDERGWFARSFDRGEWSVRGLDPSVIQCNVSHNERAGTLRGLHFQAQPHGETKVVRCTTGAMFDVVVDLRSDSSTYGQWIGVELSAENGRALYVPADCAHGFQTLVDGTEVFYSMGQEHVPEAARGVRWDDPAFGIEWPEPPPEGRTISPRDASFPDHVPSAQAR